MLGCDLLLSSFQNPSVPPLGGEGLFCHALSCTFSVSPVLCVGGRSLCCCMALQSSGYDPEVRALMNLYMNSTPR